MRYDRMIFLIIAIGILFSAATGAEPVTATIDASRPGAPVTPLIFGGFMEPATTGVWAEMLADRKFLNEITSKEPPARSGWLSFMGPARRWKPIGGDSVVEMDKKNPYVGEWSPRVRLEKEMPHGISQSGIVLVSGRTYTGRVILAGTPGARISVSLIWGANASDRQTIAINSLTPKYAKIPLKFTAKADSNDARFEIAGTGNGSFHIGAVSLMPSDNIAGFKAATIRYLKEQGIALARWPGGNFVSAYDWRDGIGDRDKRPPRRELAWNGTESNDMGIDEFMTFCRLIGAEPYIAVNAGLGDDHSAAEEVEYVNGPATSRMGRLRAANGHAAPYGVKIWGVGNEMYGEWQWGHIAITQYPEKHNRIVKAMKKVDPSIKVIASSATPEEVSWTYIENRQLDSFPERKKVDDRVPFAFGSEYDWTGALLKNSADYIDYLGEHFYGYPNLVIDADKQAFVDATDPLEHRVRRMSNKVQFKFEAWEEYLERMPYLKEKGIKFAFDEWGPRSVFNKPPIDAIASNPMLDTLTNALVYHEFMRHSDMVALAVATGGMMMLATDAHGEAVGFRPDGLLIKMLHDHFANAIPVAVDGNSPQQIIKGTIGVDLSARPSGSPTYPLDVFAALRADRKALIISVVNPIERAQELGLAIKGVDPAGGARLQQLTAPPGAAPASGFGRFSGPPAKLIESSLAQVPGRITVPPASISVYELTVK
ncbi:MAG: alpha-N-arabinofuranosidase [Acidobacteria bacterium]|nr:alpha-N-arabinofuranosidase [Acidobacteriota bacterium]